MIQRDDMYEFHVLDHLRTSTPRSSTTVLTVKAYPANEQICPVRTHCAYLERTAAIRGLEQRLFLSYQKPHKHVSRDTIFHWVTTILLEAGIDTTIFKPHSTRSAIIFKSVGTGYQSNDF